MGIVACLTLGGLLAYDCGGRVWLQPDCPKAFIFGDILVGGGLGPIFLDMLYGPTWHPTLFLRNGKGGDYRMDYFCYGYYVW